MFWKCAPEWKGEPAFVIAGGPSVKDQDVERLRGRRVIVINSSVHDYPWADILFFGDARWFRDVPENKKAVEDFAGIVVTTATQIMSPKVKRMAKASPRSGLAKDRQSLPVKRTSLTGGINLAVHRGAGPIVLLGADGKAAPDGKTHHHKPHKWPARPGCWDEQKKDLDCIANSLQERGHRVWNASPGSAWSDLWPVMTLDEALSLCRECSASETASMSALSFAS